MPCSFNILYDARPLKSQYFVFLFNCVNGENVASPLSFSLFVYVPEKKGRDCECALKCRRTRTYIKRSAYAHALYRSHKRTNARPAPSVLKWTEPIRSELSELKSTQCKQLFVRFRFLPARQAFCSRPPLWAYNDINKSKILLSQTL